MKKLLGIVVLGLDDWEIQLKDKVQWEKLYKGYADFYKVEMNDKIFKRYGAGCMTKVMMLKALS